MKPRILLPLLVFALLALWFWGREPGATALGSPDTGGDRQAAEPRAGEKAAAQRPPAPPTADARSELAPDAAPAAETGGLRVLVRWHDATPAPGIRLLIRYVTGTRIYLPVAEKCSDEDGVALFEGLAPGNVRVIGDRSSYRDYGKGEVKAGQVTDVVMTLPKGYDVRGKVLDARGRGVAGADIWMTAQYERGALGGRVVGKSGEGGQFELRSVPMGRSLGALYPMRSPSELFDLDDADLDKKPLEVTLRLGPPGGSLSGKVLDRQARPVEGAVLSLGAMPGRFRQRQSWNSHREEWTPLTARSAADGSYLFAGVAPGTHPLAVRKQGFAIRRAEVQIAGGTASSQDLVLDQGFTVVGTVFDEAGKPTPEATVRGFERAFKDTYVQLGQYDYEDVFPYPIAFTDAQGRYRLEHLPAGEALLYAGLDRSKERGPTRLPTKLYEKTRLSGGEGEELEWNPRIVGGLQISGQCLYRNGKPMPHHFVTAQASKSGERLVVTTDQEGRFRFIHLDPVVHTLSVQYSDAPKGAAPLQKHNVMPGSAGHQLVAPFDSPKKLVKGSVRGRILDPEGRIKSAEALEVILQTSRSWRTDESVEDGVFEFERVDPGRYKIVARAGETVVLVGEYFELGEGQDLDLGSLSTVPGGSLRLSMRLPEGAPDPDIRGVWLRAPTSMASQTLTLEPGQTVLVDNLNPGKHRLSVSGARLKSTRTEVEIIAGRVAEFELVLTPALLHTAHIHFSTNPPPGHLAYVLRDAAGKVVKENTLTHAQFLSSPTRLSFQLEKGSYHLVMTTKSGLKGETRLVVDDLHKDAPELELRLK